MKPLPTNVRLCRNAVACSGVFILLGSIFIVVTNPAKWIDSLEMLGGAFMCFGIVGEVNRREGRWHEEAFPGKATHHPLQEESQEIINE